ncbi:hypothetical protein [Robinsoniella sp. RHS]|uniref:hypothetical protein n=1 Tax=Robinsoniella sp. RHS TaxID=1504536 RepID=UPI0026A39BE7
MNYIELLNRFYHLLQETRVSNNAQLLYYTLLQINNRCSWSDWFARTNVSLSGMMCVSEKALTNARNELKQLGLIDFISSKKRGECTKYTLLNPTKCGTKEVQKKYKGSTKEVQSADINKQKQETKTKTEKSSTKVLPEKYAADDLLNDAILDFIAYRKASKAAITEKGMELIMKKLDRLAMDNDEKIAILHQSIENGWKGVFALKEKPKRQETDFYDDMARWVNEHECE